MSGLGSRTSPLLVKLGGRALEAPGALAACADALRAVVATGAATLVVHGGGAEVSAWCERAGAQPRFADGLRVTGANVCEVGVGLDARTGTAVVAAAVDNLVKGAAGQAIQNMNLMYGLEETAGLPTIGVYP